MLLETYQGNDELVKAYLGRWRNLSMQCREINQKTVFNICVRNLRTEFQKYFVTVKPISFAQISKVATNVEAVIKREK